MDTVSELPAKVGGMSMRDYLSHPADSRSFICSVMEHGGETQRFLEQGFSIFSGNAGTTLGSQFDSLITNTILGKSFAEQLCIPPDDVLGANGSRSTKAYKEWAGGQTGIVCSKEESWKFSRMFDSLRANDAAWDLVESTTETQQSCFGLVDGHPVKVRPDAATPELWWDLKTTSAPWSQLARSVKSYHYGEQEWLYVSVARELGMDHFRMPFLFVSTVAPFGCKVFLLPEDYVAECGVRMRAAMELIRLRRETGEYLPLDHGAVQELEIPDWVRRTTEVF
jgi:hypothetical protein